MKVRNTSRPLAWLTVILWLGWPSFALACQPMAPPEGQPQIPESVYLVSHISTSSFDTDLSSGLLRLRVHKVLRGPEIEVLKIRTNPRTDDTAPLEGRWFIGIWSAEEGEERVFMLGCWPFMISENKASVSDILYAVEKLEATLR